MFYNMSMGDLRLYFYTCSDTFIYYKIAIVILLLFGCMHLSLFYINKNY